VAAGGQARRIDGGDGGVADGGVVAVAVAGVERHHRVGAKLVDDRSHLGADERRVGGGQRARGRLPIHPRVGIPEEAHLLDTEDGRGGSELRRPQLGDVVGGDPALAGLPAGRAQHDGAVAPGRGAGQDGAAPERLVVRVRDHDQ
jgi:hypothetical protein